MYPCNLKANLILQIKKFSLIIFPFVLILASLLVGTFYLSDIIVVRSLVFIFQVTCSLIISMFLYVCLLEL